MCVDVDASSLPTGTNIATESLTYFYYIGEQECVGFFLLKALLKTILKLK